MATLTVPVTFVTGSQAVWPEIAEGRIDDIDESVLERRSIETGDVWIQQSFVRLRQAGADVRLAAAPASGAVNVVAPHAFRAIDWPTDCFTVVTRADTHLPFLANFVIEQNPLRPRPRSTFVPHWPQPNILKRDHSRGSRVHVLSFKGAPQNIDEQFRSQDFIDRLAAIGVMLRFDENKWSSEGPHWGDCRNTDMILAIRSMSGSEAKGKPASKLINSWLAETPAILGPEPAFQALRVSELDYLEARSAADVLRHMRRLAEIEDLYAAMIDHGRSRGRLYTIDHFVRAWIMALEGPVREGFEAWRRDGARRRHALSSLLEVGSMRWFDLQKSSHRRWRAAQERLRSIRAPA